MPLYLTSSGFPEMASLSGGQRKFVRKQCLYGLMQSVGFKVSNRAAIVLALLLGSYFTDIVLVGVWGRVGLLATIVLATGWLHDLFWLAHWRPRVAQFIREHQAEITLAA